MGAVSIDVHKKEREYRHLTLSDENVVRYLLEYRGLVDTSCGANINVNIFQAGDTFDFNVEIIALYASLDQIIKQLSLKDKDAEFLGLLMSGYSMSRIIEDFGFPRKTAYRTLSRIVEKIVDKNDADWVEVKRNTGYIK